MMQVNGHQRDALKFWVPAGSHCPPVREVLEAGGGSARFVSTGRHRETYLDTSERWLYKAGAVLRIREDADGIRSCLVPIEPDADHGRTICEPLVSRPDSFPCDPPGQSIADLLRPLLGERQVSAWLEVEVESLVWAFSTDGGDGFELHVRLRRLPEASPGEGLTEVTFCGMAEESDAEAARKIAERLGLRPAENAFPARALERWNLDVPSLVEGPELTIARDDRFVDATYKVLRRQFGRVLWNEPGTRLGWDPEKLHDMRVATRRMRAALRVFRGALSARRHDALKRDLKWVGGALGGVRDLDVYLKHLDEETAEHGLAESPAMARYVEAMKAERERARRAMLRVLDTQRYASFVERLQRFLEAGPPARSAAPVANNPAVVEAAGVIRHNLARVLKKGRSLGPGAADRDLHKLRIRCKRLRYACEFFEDVFGREAHDFAKRVVELQDVLGAHQDSVVAREMLHDFADGVSETRRGDRELLLVVGRLMAYHEGHRRETRARFGKIWKRFDRKKVRRPLKARLAEAGEPPCT